MQSNAEGSEGEFGDVGEWLQQLRSRMTSGRKGQSLDLDFGETLKERAGRDSGVLSRSAPNELQALSRDGQCGATFRTAEKV